MSLNFVSGGMSKPKGKYGEYGEAEETNITDADRFGSTVEDKLRDETIAEMIASTAKKPEKPRVDDEEFIPSGLLPMDEPPEPALGDKKAENSGTLYEQLVAHQTAEQDAWEAQHKARQAPKTLSDGEYEFVETTIQRDLNIQRATLTKEAVAVAEFVREQEAADSKPAVIAPTKRKAEEEKAPLAQTRINIGARIVPKKRKKRKKGNAEIELPALQCYGSSSDENV